MKNEYRILEYKDFFVIERKYIAIQNYYLFWSKKVEKWQKMNKNGNALLIIHIPNKDMYQFETKEQALQCIADFEKYPIYHYVNI